MRWPRTIAFSLSFLNESSLVLCSAISPALWHIYTAVARFSVCPSRRTLKEMPGDWLLHEESWTGLQTGINPAAGPVSAFVWGGTGGAVTDKITSSRLLVCMFLNRSVRNRLHDGGIRVPMSSNGNYAHNPTPSSLIGIHKRTPELAGHHWCPVLSIDMPKFTLNTYDRCENVWRQRGDLCCL